MTSITDLVQLREKDYNFMNIASVRSVLKCDNKGIIQKSSKNRFFIMLQNKGNFKILTDKKIRITMQYCDILFAPADTKFNYSFDSNCDNVLIGELSFDVCDEYGAPVSLDIEPTLFKSDIFKAYNNQSQKSLFEKIYYSSVMKGDNLVTIRAHFLFFLGKLIADHIYAQHAIIRPAIEFIEEHLEEKISVPQLAQMCNLSESTFCRCFKRYSNGVPPAQYVLRLKLGTALHFYNEDMTIEEIAEKLNFCDASSLCKMYKKYMGTTLKNGKQ